MDKDGRPPVLVSLLTSPDLANVKLAFAMHKTWAVIEWQSCFHFLVNLIFQKAPYEVPEDHLYFEYLNYVIVEFQDKFWLQLSCKNKNVVLFRFDSRNTLDRDVAKISREHIEHIANIL